MTMASSTYNIIGTDKDGDWLVTWCEGKKWADFWVEKVKKERPDFIRVEAVKCAA